MSETSLVARAEEDYLLLVRPCVEVRREVSRGVLYGGGRRWTVAHSRAHGSVIRGRMRFGSAHWQPGGHELPLTVYV